MFEQWNPPPGVQTEHAGYLLRWEFAHFSPRERVTIFIYLVIGAFGGLYGGFALGHETQHWLGWAVALVLLEPIGVACVVGVIALISPDSIVATFLFGAATRASIGLRLAAIAGATFIIGLLALALIQVFIG